MDRLDEVYQQYAPMIYRLSYTYLHNRDDSEDIVQEVFIKWLKHKNFKDDDHEKAWLIVTCQNLCKNHLKHWWRKNKNIDKYNIEYNDTHDEFKLITLLPIHLKTIVYLYYYEGYTSQEIGQILNKSDSTIRSQLQTARKKLKNILEEDKNE